MEEKVFKFLRDFFGTDERNPEAYKALFQSLDSLDTIDLAYQIEDKFDIKVDETAKIESVEDLVKIIQSEQTPA